MTRKFWKRPDSTLDPGSPATRLVFITNRDEAIRYWLNPLGAARPEILKWAKDPRPNLFYGGENLVYLVSPDPDP